MIGYWTMMAIVLLNVSIFASIVNYIRGKKRFKKFLQTFGEDKNFYSQPTMDRVLDRYSEIIVRDLETQLKEKLTNKLKQHQENKNGN